MHDDADQVHGDTDQPGRRGVLLLLGAGALAPAAVALLRTVPAPAVAGGIEFDVLGTTRLPLAGHGGRPRHGDGGSWPDVVRVSLRVVNVAATALLVSPGQFRLRIGDVTVMPTDWEHGPGALAAGARRTGWVDFRAPASAELLLLDFTPAGRSDPVTVPLTGARTVPR